jgi:DNA-binding NtrC family response regulator
MVAAVGKKLETILVVDDSAGVLDVVTAILERANYQVLRATNAGEAIKVSAAFDGKIHLLLSDVQMPGTSGPDLGLALKQSRPDLRVMLMTAIADGDLLVLNYGWALIRKPFLTVKLLEMVHGVLHTPDKSQGSDHYDTRKDPDKS